MTAFLDISTMKGLTESLSKAPTITLRVPPQVLAHDDLDGASRLFLIIIYQACNNMLDHKTCQDIVEQTDETWLCALIDQLNLCNSAICKVFARSLIRPSLASRARRLTHTLLRCIDKFGNDNMTFMPLRDAVSWADLELFRLIHSKCNPCKSFAHDERSALCDAILQSRTEIVRYLLDSGCRLVSDGDEPLDRFYNCASALLRLDVADEHAFDVEVDESRPIEIQGDAVFANLLYHAARTGDTDLARACLCEDVNLKFPHQLGLALYQACLHRQSHIVDMLLRSGAAFKHDPKPSWQTPLVAAVCNGDAYIVRQLLAFDTSASPQSLISGSHSPVKLAIHLGMTKALFILLPALVTNGSLSELHAAWESALQCQNQKIISLLLILGADPNHVNDRGHTMLNLAIHCCGPEIVTILLDAGADPNLCGVDTISIRGWPLRQAALAQKYEMVWLLLEAGATVVDISDGSDAIDDVLQDRSSILQLVCRSGDLELIQSVLDAGADVNAPAVGFQGLTALQIAAEEGDPVLTSFLLTLGADVNAEAAEGGKTALQAAVESGNLETIRQLLAGGAYVNNTVARNEEQTALAVAVVDGNIEITRLLLDAGANANAQVEVNMHESEVKGTLIQLAAFSGELELTRLLLKARADINAPPIEHGCMGILRRVFEGDSRGLDLPYLHIFRPTADSGGFTALQAAAKRGHLQIVRLLLDAGADINAPAAESCGVTALQAAVFANNLALILLLLARGADVNAPAARVNGRTALQAAAQGGQIAIAELLLSAGADPNGPPALKHGGITALEASVQAGCCLITQLLLRSNANVHGADSGPLRSSAIRTASSAGRTDLANILFERGADIHTAAFGPRGRTALQAAAEKGHLEMVRWLLERGAEVNAAPASDRGFTALQAAASNGALDVVYLLLEEGADVNGPAAQVKGWTALEAAAVNGRMDIVRLLLNVGASTLGSRALQYAIREDHGGVVEILRGYEFGDIGIAEDD
jgi:ankyrin repeat protein